MRKVKKFFIWVIVLSIPIGLVAYQNKTFLFEKRGIGLDLYVVKYQTPDLPIALFFLILFLTGLLISYFSSLSEKYISGKTIRRLADEVTMEKNKVSELETQIDSLQASHAKGDSAVSSAPADVPES